MDHNFEITDEDIENSASYHSTTLFGRSKAQNIADIKALHSEGESVDALSLLFAKVRTKHSKIEDGKVVVPINPPEVMWDGLVRQIMRWLSDGSKKTPRSLLQTLKSSGTPIPEWLTNDPEIQRQDHIITTGFRAVIVYKAMVQGWLNRVSSPVEALAKNKAKVTLDDLPTLKAAYTNEPTLKKTALERTAQVIDRAEESIALLVGEGLSRDLAKTLVVGLMEQAYLDREECTCLSSLSDDAYDPGGSSSGHKRPPACRLHS
jgi:hypothetical protein